MIHVHWRSTNDAATYTVTAQGEEGLYRCSSTGESCAMGGLPCGSVFSVTAVAETQAGRSPPSFSVSLETGRWLPPASMQTSVWSLEIVTRHELSYVIDPKCDRNTLNSLAFHTAPVLENKTCHVWTQVL